MKHRQTRNPLAATRGRPAESLRRPLRGNRPQTHFGLRLFKDKRAARLCYRIVKEQYAAAMRRFRLVMSRPIRGWGSTNGPVPFAVQPSLLPFRIEQKSLDHYTCPLCPPSPSRGNGERCDARRFTPSNGEAVLGGRMRHRIPRSRRVPRISRFAQPHCLSNLRYGASP